MTVSATESTGGLLAQISGASGDTQGANSMDKDTFLQLLVAQLRYQDPMNPTDSTQFLAQSAQFTALEKMEAVAEQTAQAVGAQMAFGASSLVGRTVTYTDADGRSVTGTVDAVNFKTDGPVLDVGGTEVALGNVQTVADGRRTAADTTGTTTTESGSGSAS
ncbi:MAG TPA: flagellar hook capping FlgD N-terminal domain-containing protein [Nocardioidaceae bacterium]|jgi:flagellar basal-body rod modification protein FlgD|nr:flagellar hook capping FlgD N-terminal domain-containing protein [Nocardioidaceae bacterium]